MPVLYPFKEYDLTDFGDVVIPLADADRHRSTVDVERCSLASRFNDPALADVKLENAEVKSTAHASSSSATTLESLRAEVNAQIAASGHDTIYDRKSQVVNIAIQDIGMTRYQWGLFFLCGGGWLADNLWLQGVALTLPSLQHEFGISETSVRYTTLAMFVGLCLGAVFWGCVSDIVGRRPAFKMTLFIASVFGIAAGGANTWIGVCALYAAMVSQCSSICVPADSS